MIATRIFDPIQRIRFCSSWMEKIPKVTCEVENPEALHLENQKLHQKHGPVYLQEVSPGVNLAWISDAGICQSVFRSEGPRPHLFLPVAWKVYGQKYNVKRGILFKEGLDWEETRKKINPYFLKDKVDISGYIQDVTDGFVQRLEDEVNKTPKNFNMNSLIEEWAVSNVIGALYGDTFKDVKEEMNERIRDLIEHNKAMFAASTKLQLLSAENECENETPLWMKFKTSADSVLDIGATISRDLLSDDPQHGGLANAMHREKAFTEDQIHTLTTDMIIAASDTTSFSTLWTLYLLGKHPEEQEKIRTRQNPIQWAIKEALRLYPVAPFLTRVPDSPIPIADDAQLPPGGGMLLSLYAMGRDPRYYDNPDAFMPERWRRDGDGRRRSDAFAFLPFGFGVRSCIGKKIADAGMRLLIGQIVDKFQFRNIENVNYVMKLIGVPDRPVKLSFERTD